MNEFNNNVIGMHDNGIVQLSQASTISNEFIKIRLNAVKARSRYELKYAVSIAESDNQFSTIF